MANEFLKFQETVKAKGKITMYCCDGIAMLADVAYQRMYADTPKADHNTLTEVINLCLKAQALLAQFIDEEEIDADEPDQDRTAADDAADDPRHNQGDILLEPKL